MADPEPVTRRAPTRPPSSIARAAAAGAWIAFAVQSSCTAWPGSRPAAVSDCRAFQPQPTGPKTTAVPRAARHGAAWNLGRRFDHVLIVVLENQDHDAVLRERYFGGL